MSAAGATTAFSVSATVTAASSDWSERQLPRCSSLCAWVKGKVRGLSSTGRQQARAQAYAWQDQTPTKPLTHLLVPVVAPLVVGVVPVAPLLVLVVPVVLVVLVVPPVAVGVAPLVGVPHAVVVAPLVGVLAEALVLEWVVVVMVVVMVVVRQFS